MTGASYLRSATIGAFMAAVAACGPQSQAQVETARPSALQEVPLSPGDAGAMGVFDPSLASDGGGTVHMAFSAVDPAAGGPRNERIVTTFLARSEDSGGRWRVIGGPVNPAIDVTLGPEAGGGGATWHNEVAALLHDPYAHPSERWKLLWHRYLIAGERRLFEHGWIGYRAAATPEELASEPETKLFGGLGYSAVNDDPNGATRSPIPGPPRIPLHERHAELARCVAFTEPAMTPTASALFLALNCAEFRAGGVAPKVVLLRCARPCRIARPDSWAFVRTLLTPEDAVPFGAKGFSAADFHVVGGAHYLIASPTSDRPFPDAYNGCLVFRFADLASGRFQHDAGGRLAPVLGIAGAPNSFSGACSADAGAYGGRLLIGQLDLRGGRPRFAIFVSGSALR